MSALNQQILMLDKQYQIVRVAPVTEAIPLLFVEKVVVLDSNYQTYSFEQWIEQSRILLEDNKNLPHIVRSPTVTLVIPEVMVITTGYTKTNARQRRIKFNRNSVFRRDNFTCQYCAKKLIRKDLTIDHVIPKVQGGTTAWLNVVAACRPCNTRKGGRTPEQANMRLIHRPSIPNWMDQMQINTDNKVMWDAFINS